ncbi:TPA: DoxX family protein [Klebsiella pneumoniae]|nr:DoxX family protein [Klebsiella pneumoniae]
MMVENIILWSVIVFFLVDFILNISGPKPIREEFSRWGIPQWVRFATGSVEGIIAILLIFKLWTIVALSAAALLMTAAVQVVLYNQEMRRALIPFSVLVLILISLAQHM